MTIQPLIELRDAKKRFGENDVLNGVDLHIFKGEITSIIGKSGVGKSVLLKHIIGLLEPDSGQVLYEGKSTACCPGLARPPVDPARAPAVS